MGRLSTVFWDNFTSILQKFCKSLQLVHPPDSAFQFPAEQTASAPLTDKIAQIFQKCPNKPESVSDPLLQLQKIEAQIDDSNKARTLIIKSVQKYSNQSHPESWSLEDDITAISKQLFSFQENLNYISFSIFGKQTKLTSNSKFESHPQLAEFTNTLNQIFSLVLNRDRNPSNPWFPSLNEILAQLQTQEQVFQSLLSEMIKIVEIYRPPEFVSSLNTNTQLIGSTLQIVSQLQEIIQKSIITFLV